MASTWNALAAFVGVQMAGLESQLEGPSRVQVALGAQFGGPSRVQVALGGQFEGPNGVQVALGGHLGGPNGVQVAFWTFPLAGPVRVCTTKERMIYL